MYAKHVIMKSADHCRSKKKFKNHLEISENKDRKIQNLWYAAKVVLSEVYSDKSLPKETRQISNRQPNLTPQTTREKNKQNAKIAEGKKS